MKLVLKLTLALTLGICTVFAAYAFISVRRQADQFVADALRDQHMLARAVATAVSTVWSIHGRDSALQLIGLIDEREAKTRILWVDLEAPEAERDERVTAAERESLLAGHPRTFVDGSDVSLQRIRTIIPVAVYGRVVGAIALRESLAEERAFLRGRVERTLLTGALMIVVSSLLAVALGAHFVGTPVRKLVEKARRIGHGDFGRPLLLRQRDEIAELASEMNAMAAQLAATHERLEEASRVQIAALEQLRHAERLSIVGRLASGVAHELGTPLNIISGRSQMIASGEACGPDVATCANIISKQATRMTEIVRQLLNLARRRTPERSPTDIYHLVSETIDLLRPLAGRAGVMLKLDDSDAETSAPISIDAAQIRQVITNLALNAIQASPKGRTVAISISRATLPSRSGPQRPFIRVRISDEGRGIPAAVLPHIFEPFYTTKEVGEGTGLGLSVAYGIVEDHGGWIDVQTVEGSGSRFSVHLPQR